MGLERFIYFFRTGRDGRKTAYRIGGNARDVMDVIPAEQDRMEVPRGPRDDRNGREEE